MGWVDESATGSVNSFPDLVAKEPKCDTGNWADERDAS